MRRYDARLRRQFERARMLDGAINQLVVEQGSDISAKFGIPLADGAGRIGFTLRRDHRVGQSCRRRCKSNSYVMAAPSFEHLECA
jgi:hypothetical protein